MAGSPGRRSFARLGLHVLARLYYPRPVRFARVAYSSTLSVLLCAAPQAWAEGKGPSPRRIEPAAWWSLTSRRARSD